MRQRLLLWDIDGTLIRAGSLGPMAFLESLEEVVGRRPAIDVSMSGKTDPQIVREYLQQMDEPVLDETVVAVLAYFERLVSVMTDQLKAGGYVCPGAAELLERAAGDDRVISSVLTGNIAPNALVKLAAFGLDRWLDLSIGAYGSDHHDRNQLVPVAMGRLADERQIRLEPDDVWVIGDTPRDLDCARAAGAHCLLVATGRSGLAELGALGADSALGDLSDTDAVYKLLTA